MGQGMLRPRISLRDGERALGIRLRDRKIVAQLAGKGFHREEIRIVRVHRREPGHVGAKPWAHVLLAEDVVEELGELRGQEIARPLRGDRFHGVDGTQIVVFVPEGECPMERALAWVHRQGRARGEVRAGAFERAVGLAVEPESRGQELQDRRLRSALDGVEDRLDTLIETQ